MLGAAGDYATSVDRSAPLSSKVLGWANELGLLMSPYYAGGGALAAATGAAQTGQAMAEADPCHAPIVPPPAATEPPEAGPPPGRSPSGPHPVSTLDQVVSTGEKVAGGVAGGAAVAWGAMKSAAGDAAPLLEAIP